MGLLNEIEHVVHSDCSLLDYINEDYVPLNKKVSAYRNIRCDYSGCMRLLHASSNENLVEWIETLDGNYCPKFLLRKHGKKTRVVWIDVITGEPIESMANCDSDGYYIPKKKLKQRFCQCGAKVEPRRRYCVKCRDRRRKDTYRRGRK